MFHLFLLPINYLKQMGEGVLVTLTFVYLQVRRIEQVGRVCFKLSGIRSRVDRSRIYLAEFLCCLRLCFRANHISPLSLSL